MTNLEWIKEIEWNLKKEPMTWKEQKNLLKAFKVMRKIAIKSRSIRGDCHLIDGSGRSTNGIIIDHEFENIMRKLSKEMKK